MFVTLLSRLFPVFFRLEEKQLLISELFEYFKDKFFTPQFGDYNNFSFGNGSSFSFETLVYGFFIGINLASLAIIFDRRVLGDFVRKLISEDCLSKENAKTLIDLGYYKNTAIRGSLKNGVTLRRVVRCVEEEEYNGALKLKRAEYEAVNSDVTPSDNSKISHRRKKQPEFRETPYKIDLQSAHFYIPNDLKYTAEIKFNKKGTNWLSFFAVFVISLFLMVIVIQFVPDILQMLDNFITMFFK